MDRLVTNPSPSSLRGRVTAAAIHLLPLAYQKRWIASPGFRRDRNDSEIDRARANIVSLTGGAGLIFLYLFYYFRSPVLPRPGQPGWLSWWDQSQYLASATALAHLNFAPALHLYPLAYSLIAAPFTFISPLQPFFLPDLIALLSAYAGFMVVANRLGIQPVFAATIFILTTFGDPHILAAWVEPWNTSLSAAFIWGALACAADILKRAASNPPRLRLVLLLGLLAGSLPLVRPTDLSLACIILAFTGAVAWRRFWLTLTTLSVVLLGIAIVSVPYILLHLRIYGPHPSPYMLAERSLGFTPGWLGWKLYEIIISPRPWYPSGVSMLARFPWLIFSFAGLVLLALKPRRQPDAIIWGLMAAMVMTTWAIFISYVDMTPGSLWYYGNIHYFKWTFPALGLFAFWFIKELIAGTTRPWAIASLAAVFLISMVRLTPVPARPNDAVDLVQLPGASLPWDTAYLSYWHFTDAKGALDLPLSVRVIPDREGLRLIPQRRALYGTIIWTDQPFKTAGGKSWTAKIGIGTPCWLPPHACNHLQPKS